MTEPTLAGLGWSDHFAGQLEAGDTSIPARISAVHRDRVDALSTDGLLSLTTPNETGTYAVGDWVLSDGRTVVRLLDRLTTVVRRAAGEVARDQLIAANVDTLGIVTSCNADFNPARLERYLALCNAGGVVPLVILTKADLAEDPDSYRQRAERLSPSLTAITLNALDPDDVSRLTPWCGAGQTLALVGSSGVGKTTIQNTLTGTGELTKAIRSSDAKGRHATTARALRPTIAGGWLIDTPGMRELRLTEAAEGIETVFADIFDLATNCRFADCRHANEPGCAIHAAITSGDLDPTRLARWQKLMREDKHNSESVIQSRARHRSAARQHTDGKAKPEWKRR